MNKKKKMSEAELAELEKEERQEARDILVASRDFALQLWPKEKVTWQVAVQMHDYMKDVPPEDDEMKSFEADMKKCIDDAREFYGADAGLDPHAAFAVYERVMLGLPDLGVEDEDE